MASTMAFIMGIAIAAFTVGIVIAAFTVGIVIRAFTVGIIIRGIAIRAFTRGIIAKDTVIIECIMVTAWAIAWASIFEVVVHHL